MVEGIIGLVSDYNNNKLTKEELKFKLETLGERQAHEVNLAQIDLNKEESKGNWFQSGWRPATGWTCVIGFNVNFLVVPIANFALAMNESAITIPTLDLATMMPVLLGMLGLGGYRTYEKVKGKN